MSTRPVQHASHPANARDTGDKAAAPACDHPACTPQAPPNPSASRKTVTLQPSAVPPLPRLPPHPAPRVTLPTPTFPHCKAAEGVKLPLAPAGTAPVPSPAPLNCASPVARLHEPGTPYGSPRRPSLPALLVSRLAGLHTDRSWGKPGSNVTCYHKVRYGIGNSLHRNMHRHLDPKFFVPVCHVDVTDPASQTAGWGRSEPPGPSGTFPDLGRGATVALHCAAPEGAWQVQGTSGQGTPLPCRTPCVAGEVPRGY